jgi:hypothetical protein
VIVTLEGQGLSLVEGKPRMTIQSIEGHRSGKVSWIIRSGGAKSIQVKASTRIAWEDTKTVTLGGSR